MKLNNCRSLKYLQKLKKSIMKFLFCGDNSSPEWFLAESAILTKIVDNNY